VGGETEVRLGDLGGKKNFFSEKQKVWVFL
jgi:hypothetical protein